MNIYFMRFPQGKTKAVTLSYDDGCRTDLHLARIINEYGIKCTFNISSKFIAADSCDFYLTKEEIKEALVDTGHEIAIHGAYHKAPGMTDPTDGILDVIECRRDLERAFGGIIKGMAYPNSGILHFENGCEYKDVKRYLSNLGIAYARSLGADNDGFYLPDDWYNWKPTAHHDNPNIMNYIEKFIGVDINSLYSGDRWPRLFYLWGHSYEYENNNNWDKLDKICAALSANKDIWYATNIEIFNYVSAYRSLQFNVDRTVVYNPTLYTIWFCADNTDYRISPDETLKIS